MENKTPEQDGAKGTTINVTATPEQIANRFVVSGAEDSRVRLVGDSNYGYIAEVPRVSVRCAPGHEVRALRAWLAGLIREGYKAGVESVTQTKADGAAALAETYGPDALAKAREEGAALGRSEANVECGNELRAALGENHGWNACIALVRILVAKDGSERIGDRLAKAREEGRREGRDELLKLLRENLQSAEAAYRVANQAATALDNGEVKP